MSGGTYRKGMVFVQNKFAGIISETDNGYRFVYNDGYLNDKSAVAVSITLPLEKKTFESKTLFSFFDGLIPEGWLLNIVSKNWKIDQRDRFGLLLASCRDSIGDVAVQECE